MSGSEKRAHSSAEIFSRSMFESRASAVDRTRSFKVFVIRIVLFVGLVLSLSHWRHALFKSEHSPLRRSIIHSFSFLASHCANVPPISALEFHSRQRALAEVLHTLDVAAYIAEPGANALFFGNISATQWSLSERPLLLIISPEVIDGIVHPKISIVTPTFESTRAKLLPISSENVAFLEWPEDSSPYETAVSAFSGRKGNVYVDGMMRKFVADGLAAAAPSRKVLSAPLEVMSLRQRKSPAEIRLLRCANEVTLMAIRAASKEFYIGMRESEARVILTRALSDAGLKDVWSLMLFGENAALPHGSGTDRVLGKEDFVLTDSGGTLHGYHSDITRTFALKDSTIPSDHLKIWFLVKEAQSAALDVAHNGSLTRGVDVAARNVFAQANLDQYFTHRLGHGIGLEDHEDPYLRGGSEDIIRSGHAYSDEPGIYINGKIGVRLEDIFYINENGSAEFLTEGVGGQANTPWLF